MKFSQFKIKVLPFVIGCLLAQTVFGQTADMPRPSPKASVAQTIGVTAIKINYSRPMVKGRTIFGTLVPFGKVWRTGANESTNISFEHDIKLGGQLVKAGSYALMSIPNKNSWTIILNHDDQQFGAYNYDEKKDALRVEIKPEQASFYEMFTIHFSEITLTTGLLELRWEHTSIKIPIEIDTHAITVNEFEKADKEISKFWYTYSAAGHYYHQIVKDDSKAIAYLDKAIGLRAPNPSPWMLKSQILASQGKYKEAIAVAEEALKVSKANKEFHFEIEENEEAIKRWKKKL